MPLLEIMKTTTATTMLVALFLALIYFTDGKGDPLPETKTVTKPEPKHTVNKTVTTSTKKPENATTAISGNVTYGFSDEVKETFHDNSLWKKATN